MKRENFPTFVSSKTQSPQSTREDIGSLWQRVVKRRSFLKGIGIAGATLSAGALLVTKGNAQTTLSTGRLPKSDVALLRFAAAVELIESDLWVQYNELGGANGVVGHPVFGTDAAYVAALSNLDGDMPQYISDNTDDEL